MCDLLPLGDWWTPTAGWWARLENGSRADWVSAISTSLAMVFAAAAAIVAKRVYDIEDRRDQSALLDRTAAQASCVSAWCDRIEVPSDKVKPDDLLRLARGRTFADPVVVSTSIILRNASQLPVYDLETFYPPFPFIQRRPLLAPGDHTFAGGDGVVERSDSANVRAAVPTVAINFRDSAGNRWVRTYEGALLRVDSDAARDEAMGPLYTSAKRVHEGEGS